MYLVPLPLQRVSKCYVPNRVVVFVVVVLGTRCHNRGWAAGLGRFWPSKNGVRLVLGYDVHLSLDAREYCRLAVPLWEVLRGPCARNMYLNATNPPPW